jgi:hypothetical protein
VSDPILTDDQGRPFAKPDPKDFASTLDWLRAYWAYRDATADCANKAFDTQFRKVLKARR